MKKSRLIFFTLLFLIIVFFSYTLSTHLLKGRENESYVLLKIAVPNIYPEVAESIKVGDFIIDRQGKKVFRIKWVFIKPAEHPVETCDGKIVKSEHPLLKSAIIKVESIKPSKSLIVTYNRVTARIGAKLIFETPKTRFVGVVINIESEKK